MRCCYLTKTMTCKKKQYLKRWQRKIEIPYHDLYRPVGHITNNKNEGLFFGKLPAILNYSLLEIEFNIWAYQPSVLSHLVKDKHIYYSTFIMVIYCIVLWPNFMARSLNIYDTFFFLVSIVTLHVRYVFFFGGDFFAHRSWNLLYVLFLM